MRAGDYISTWKSVGGGAGRLWASATICATPVSYPRDCVLKLFRVATHLQSRWALPSATVDC